MHDYQESVTTGQTDAGQSDPYVPLCFAGDTIKLTLTFNKTVCCDWSKQYTNTYYIIHVLLSPPETKDLLYRDTRFSIIYAHNNRETGVTNFFLQVSDHFTFELLF